MDYELAIEEAYAAANEKWKENAEKRLYYLAKRRLFFTSEDILSYLDAKGIKTRNNSALGAIMRNAARNGIIEPAGYETAVRASRHKAPIRKWKSTIVRLYHV